MKKIIVLVDDKENCILATLDLEKRKVDVTPVKRFKELSFLGQARFQNKLERALLETTRLNNEEKENAISNLVYKRFLDESPELEEIMELVELMKD